MESGLSGRAALVTGASGGIGWAAACMLAREGCKVALQARQGASLLRTRLAEAKLPTEAMVIEADVRDADSVEAMFDSASAQLGDIAVCVASAGIWPEESVRLDELSPERLENVLGTNLFGTIWTARSFLRQVRSRGIRGSSLVLIGSTAGRFGEAGHADYSISKAGLRGLMLSYKNEVVHVDPQGRCNLVEPGWTATPMTDAALDDDALLRRVTRTMPLRQIATVDDIAAAIVYFASPRLSAHVSGETLTVAGGMEGRSLWQESEIDPVAIRQRLRGAADSR